MLETMFSNFFRKMKRIYPHLYFLRWQDLQVRSGLFYNLNEQKSQRKKLRRSNAPRLDFEATFAVSLAPL